MVSNSLHRWLGKGVLNDASHPAQVALRTYGLSLSLSLGPSLLPFVVSLVARDGRSFNVRKLRAVLKKELGINGFAFAMTAAVGGGAAIQRLWNILEESKDWPWEGAHSHDPSSNASKAFPSEKYPWTKLQKWLASPSLSPWQKDFMANCISCTIAIYLLQGGRRRTAIPASGGVPIPYTPPLPGTSSSGRITPTLDLTLLLLVRAADALIQSEVWKRTDKYRPGQEVDGSEDVIKIQDLQCDLLRRKRQDDIATRWRAKMTSRIDASVFWLCSARIMWCFFYTPDSLPKSYLKWIAALADIDHRLLSTLRAIRDGKWSYLTSSPSHSHLLTSLAQDVGYPTAWANPDILPAYGGAVADEVWRRLGVTSRPGVGGLPCELVHAGAGRKFGFGEGCLGNISARTTKAFLEALAIYTPAHLLPLLLSRPGSLLRCPNLLRMSLSILRSSFFLTTFVVSYWLAVCVSRTLLLARLLPWVSHDFWDGPHGCAFLGSLVCGGSIFIEQGRRRGEMALYVAPRALRTWIPDSWLRGEKLSLLVGERLAFVVSLSWLLTAAVHRPDSLRGLSRWALAFVTRGPSAGWRRGRQSIKSSLPSTDAHVAVDA